MAIKLQQIFAHATATVLSWHVQNFVAITSLNFGGEQKEVTDAKNHFTLSIVYTKLSITKHISSPISQTMVSCDLTKLNTTLKEQLLFMTLKTLGLNSLSSKTTYCQLSWSLEATRLNVIIIILLWNLTGISTALLLMWLSNFRAILKV